jgi:3-hydroxybutyryl-CoA dehydrogenase
LLTNMVNANNLGIKTGEGFYTYTKDSKELVVSERFM